tara:strand:+ start:110 stop:544 length:435 start_codon:yes stop_codon:yes gene_type:complete
MHPVCDAFQNDKRQRKIKMKVINLSSHEPAVLTLTKTMLEKAIIDANTSVRNFSKLFGIDYDVMQSGDKESITAEFLDGSESQINFYRTKNNRADRRISIKGIKKQANVGDTLAITSEINSKGESVLIINVTQNLEYKSLVKHA